MLIIVVWLFVLAPLLLRGQRPIRKAGQAFSETRVVHEGGSELPPDVRRKPRVREQDAHRTPVVDSNEERYEVVPVVAEEPADDPASEAAAIETVVDGDVVQELPSPEPAAVEKLQDPGEEETGETPGEKAHPAGTAESAEREDLPDFQWDEDFFTSPADMLYPDDDASSGSPTDEEPRGPLVTAAEAEWVEATNYPGEMETDVDASDELTDEELQFAARRRGRGGWDPEADPTYAKLRYQRRQRMALSLVAVVAVTLALAAVVGAWTWWLVGAAVGCLVVYLVALRRQVRQEQELRRRRIRQLRRARLGVRHRDDEELVIPRQLRRPGAIVVEVDDESPDFAHLDRVRRRSPDSDGDAPTSDHPWQGHRVAG